MKGGKAVRLAYSVAELCQTLGVSRDGIYAAIRRGELSAIKMGRRTLITHEAVEAFLLQLPRLGPAHGSSVGKTAELSPAVRN